MLRSSIFALHMKSAGYTVHQVRNYFVAPTWPRGPVSRVWTVFLAVVEDTTEPSLTIDTFICTFALRVGAMILHPVFSQSKMGMCWN